MSAMIRELEQVETNLETACNALGCFLAFNKGLPDNDPVSFVLVDQVM